MKTDAFRKMLVICLAGAGDTLMTTPLLKELRCAFPAAEIDVLVMQGPAACEVLAGNPNITRIIHHNFMKEPYWKSLRLCFNLRRHGYDCSISPMPHNRLAYNVISFLVGAKVRVGFSYAIRCGAMERPLLNRVIAEDAGLHLVDNNLRLLPEAFGIPLASPTHRLELFPTPENRKFASDFIEQHGLQGLRLIGFHPGSGTTKNLILKRWPAEKWAELARMVCADPAARVLLFGGRDERALMASVSASAALPDGRVLIPETPSVSDTAALIGRLACFVSADTLLTHLAAAAGIPSVTIYGPTSHVVAYPYGAEHRVVRTGISCSPCYGYSRHGIRCTNPVFMACLHGVSADMVYVAIRSAVSNQSSVISHQ